VPDRDAKGARHQIGRQHLGGPTIGHDTALGQQDQPRTVTSSQSQIVQGHQRRAPFGGEDVIADTGRGDGRNLMYWALGGDTGRRFNVRLSDGQAFAIFEEVPAGPIAVSVFHDEDDDGELDSAALGIPSEAFGFSANARDMFGPPSFEEARIELVAGETKQITIKVK